MWSEYSLEVVDAVARNGSFSAAAQELHRVPSAVSYTVRQLEEWLGGGGGGGGGSGWRCRSLNDGTVMWS